VAVGLVFGLAGCGEEPGPAESVGKKIDQATEESLRQMNKAAEKAIRELNETAAKLNKELGEASIALGEEGKKMAAVLDDAAITSQVKAAIFAEPTLRTQRLDVETRNGVVYLSGSVDSTENRDLVERLAGEVTGVKEVDSHLSVKIKQK